MPRIATVDPAAAEGKSRALLEGVQKALGRTPNMMKTLAHSPSALESYLSFSKTLGGGSLDAKLREQLALAVAGVNECGYCAAAHTAIGKHAGVSDTDLRAALKGDSSDPRTRAALTFAKAITTKRGFVTDDDLKAVRSAGFNDGQVLEILAAVVLNIFTNYVNHLAQTELDFPKVEMGHPVHA